MRNMKWLMIVGAVACMIAVSAPSAHADTAKLVKSKYSDSSFTGGEFRLYDISSSIVLGVQNSKVGPAGEFQTFCLELSEGFPSNTDMVLSIDTFAEMGGNSLAANPDVPFDVAGGSGKDPLSAATAYLYTQFITGQLSSYDYDDGSVGSSEAGREASAISLQKAIWYLEMEINKPTGDTQAMNWITEATGAISTGAWSGLGNVRVANLTYNGAPKQSQLIYVPLPAGALLGLGLLGLLGVGRYVRRRKQ